MRAQIDALRAAGCSEVFEDAGVSDGIIARGGLDACLNGLHASGERMTMGTGWRLAIAQTLAGRD
jgi:hypothetical protein